MAQLDSLLLSSSFSASIQAAVFFSFRSKAWYLFLSETFCPCSSLSFHLIIKRHSFAASKNPSQHRQE